MSTQYSSVSVVLTFIVNACYSIYIIELFRNIPIAEYNHVLSV